MPGVKLPDGRVMALLPGQSVDDAWEVAKKKYPDAFDTSKPEEGFIPAVKASLYGNVGQAGLAASGLGILSEEKAREAAKKQEEYVQKHVYKRSTYGDFESALDKHSWINTTPAGQPGADEAGGGVQLLKYWRDQLGGMVAPGVATAAGSVLGGAAAGAMGAGPIGAGVGAVLGGFAGNYPFQGLQNYQEQLDVQAKRGVTEPIEHGKAWAAAVPQALLDSASQLFMLRGLGFSAKRAEALLAKSVEERTAAVLAKSKEHIVKAGAKGIGTGLVEVPTEIAQQVLQRWQAGEDIFDPEAMQSYKETAVGVSGPAGLLGMLGGMHGRRSARLENDANLSKAAQAKAAADAKAAEEKKIADLPGDVLKLHQLGSQRDKFEALLAGKTLSEEGNAVVRKKLEDINAEIGALGERVTELGETPPIVRSQKGKVVGEELDADALLAANEAAQAKAKEEEGDAYLQNRFAGVDDALNKKAKQKKPKFKAPEEPGDQQYDAYGRERPEWIEKKAREAADLKKLTDAQETRFQAKLMKGMTAAHEQEKTRQAGEVGADIAANRAEVLLDRFRLPHLLFGQDDKSKTERRDALVNIDAGLVDRPVQRALGLPEGRRLVVNDPAHAEAVLPQLEARLAELQGEKDAFLAEGVELNRPDGQLTKVGMRAVKTEAQIQELRKLQEKATETVRRNTEAPNLLSTYASRAAAEEEAPADLGINDQELPEREWVPEKLEDGRMSGRWGRKYTDAERARHDAARANMHEKGFDRSLEGKTRAFDELRDALDDIRDGSHMYGENAEESSVHVDDLKERAQSAKNRYVSAALRHAAHYRAMRGLPPISKTEAIRAAEEMHAVLDEFVARSTVKPELITEPAQMRGTELVKGAREYWGYPGVQPYGDQRAVAGSTGFEEESGFTGGASRTGQAGEKQMAFGVAVPKDMQVWSGSGAPRGMEQSQRPLRNLKHHIGPVQQALSAVTSGLKQEKKGERTVTSELLKGQDGPQVARAKEEVETESQRAAAHAYGNSKRALELALNTPDLTPEVRAQLQETLKSLKPPKVAAKRRESKKEKEARLTQEAEDAKTAATQDRRREAAVGRAEAERAALEKDLPRYRAYVAGRIENLLGRLYQPGRMTTVKDANGNSVQMPTGRRETELTKTLQQALDMLDAGRGPRSLVENIEKLVSDAEIASRTAVSSVNVQGARHAPSVQSLDTRLLAEVKQGVAADAAERGTEGTGKTSLEKQPDLFEAEPRINQSVRDAEKTYEEASTALDAFKGKKLDLAGMKAYHEALKKQEDARVGLWMLRAEQEREGSPFTRQGLDAAGKEIARGAEIKSTAKKFIAFLNSKAVKTLKDYFTPGWRALNKAKAEVKQQTEQDKKEAKRRDLVDKIDARIEKLRTDPRFMPISWQGHAAMKAAVPGLAAEGKARMAPPPYPTVDELPDNATGAQVREHQKQVQAYTDHFIKWERIIQENDAREKAYKRAAGPLLRARVKLRPETYGPTGRTAEQQQEIRAANAIKEVYAEAEKKLQFLTDFEKDVDVGKLREYATAVREEIAKLDAEMNPSHQWAAEANHQLRQQAAELDRIAKQYEDAAASVEEHKSEAFAREFKAAEAAASKSVQAQKMALERLEAQHEEAVGIVEMQRKHPLSITRTLGKQTRDVSGALTFADEEAGAKLKRHEGKRSFEKPASLAEEIKGAKEDEVRLKRALARLQAWHKTEPLDPGAMSRFQRDRFYADEFELQQKLAKVQEHLDLLTSGGRITTTSPFEIVKSHTYLAERASKIQNEVQQQRAAVRAAEREAQAQRDKLNAEHDAYLQRQVTKTPFGPSGEHDVVSKKTQTVSELEGEETDDTSGASSVRYVTKLSAALKSQAAGIEERIANLEDKLKTAKKPEDRSAIEKGLKKLNADLTRVSAEGQNSLDAQAHEMQGKITALKEELKGEKPGSIKHRALVRQIIKATNTRKRMKAENMVAFAGANITTDPNAEEVTTKAQEARAAAIQEAKERREKDAWLYQSAEENRAAAAQTARELRAQENKPVRRESPKLPTAMDKREEAAQKLQKEILSERSTGALDAYNGEPGVDDRFSQGDVGLPSGNTDNAVTNAILENLDNDAGFHRLVTVVQREDELPDAVRNDSNYRAGTRGVVHKGHIWLVADAIPKGEEMAVFLHEAGAHLGFDENPNDRLWLRKQVEGWAKGEGVEAEAAREALERGGRSDDEVVAYATEGLVKRGVTPNTNSKGGGWLRRLAASFKAMLRKIGIRLGISPQELVDMAYGAAKIEMEHGQSTDNGSVPRFSQAKANPEFAAAHPAFDSLQDKIVAKDKTLKDKLANFLGDFYRNVVDSQGPYMNLVRRAVKTGAMSDANGIKTSYYMDLALRNHYLTSESLNHGPVSLLAPNAAGQREVRSAAGVNLPQMVDALAPLVGRIGDAAYVGRAATTVMLAKRAEELGPNGWDTLHHGKDEEGNQTITPAERKAALDLYNQHPEFQKFAELYHEYNTKLIDFNVQAGALPKAVGERFNKSKFFVPYYRENANHTVSAFFDEGQPVSIGNLKDSPYLHELVGGKSKVLDFMDSVQQNTALLIGKGTQNLAAKSGAYELQRLGLAYIDYTGSQTGPNVIHFNEEPKDEKDNGFRSAVVGEEGKSMQVEKYKKQLGRIPPDSRAFEIVRAKMERAKAASGQFSDVDGELLAKSFEGLSTTIPVGLRMLSDVSNVLRKGITRNPLYSAKQMLRDPMAAWLGTGADINPFLSSWGELAKVMGGKTADYKEAQSRGMIGGQVFNGTEEDVKKLMRMHMETGGTGTLWTALDRMSILSDGMTRVALMKKFEAQGLTPMEVTLAVNNSMNFTRRGASASMHMLHMLIPFFNAQIRGLDVVYKALSGNMTAGEKVAAFDKLWRRGAMVTAGTLLYMAAMKDDDAYKNASPMSRLNNFFVPVPGLKEPIKIPIPFEFGFIFKALPEHMLLASQKKGEYGDVWQGLSQVAQNMIPGGSINPFTQLQAVKPITEAYFNKETFSGLPITSDHLARLDPDKRAGPRTSELAKYIGGFTGKLPGGEYLSPVMLDHFINGYLGGLGTNAAALANFAMPWGMVRKDNAGPVTKQLHELPFVGQAFQAQTGMGLVTQGYEMAKKMQMAKNTLDEIVKSGDAEGAREYAEGHKQELGLAAVAQQFTQEMNRLNQAERATRLQPKDVKGALSPDEKADVIRKIQEAKIKRARAFAQEAARI